MCGVPVSRAGRIFAEAYPQGLPRGGGRAARRPGGGEAARAEGGGAARRGAAGDARHAHRGCAAGFRQRTISSRRSRRPARPRRAIIWPRSTFPPASSCWARPAPPDLEGELLRLRPAEILVPEDELGDAAIKRASEAAGAPLSPSARTMLHQANGERLLKEAFEVPRSTAWAFSPRAISQPLPRRSHYVNLMQGRAARPCARRNARRQAR